MARAIYIPFGKTDFLLWMNDADTFEKIELVHYQGSTQTVLATEEIDIDYMEENYSQILDEASRKYDQIEREIQLEEELGREAMLERDAEHNYDMDKAENF